MPDYPDTFVWFAHVPASGSKPSGCGRYIRRAIDTHGKDSFPIVYALIGVIAAVLAVAVEVGALRGSLQHQERWLETLHHDLIHNQSDMDSKP